MLDFSTINLFVILDTFTGADLGYVPDVPERTQIQVANAQ